MAKSGRAALGGNGYDARRALGRPLVRVPGVEAVKRFAAYPSKIYYGNSEIKASTISEWEEGGCALLGDGSVRCWERDFCTKGATWRSANVEALPKIQEISLGAEDGYAIDERGLVHTWPRPKDRSAGACPASALGLRARTTTLPRTKRMGGGVVVVEAEPMTVAVDCAVLETNGVVCWRSPEELDARPAQVTLPP